MDLSFRKGIPTVSVTLVILTVLLSFLDQLTNAFTLYPGYILSQPWTLVTAGLVETGFITITFNLFLLLFMSKYFEERWGSQELLKHFLIVSISTNAITAIIMILQYAFSGGYYDPLFTKIYGTGSFICSLLVAYKRAIPEHKIKILQRISIRVKYIPSLNILVHTILFAVGIISTTFYTHTIGSITSWVYIRYYKYHDGIKGDRSETFSFASFFPDSMHIYLKPISTRVYNTLVILKLLPPLPPRVNAFDVDLESPPSQEVVPEELDPNSTHDEDFEMSQVDAQKRRKELAQKALEARLLQKQQQ